MIKLVFAKNKAHICMVHKLFTEYAKSLGFDLCFQNFDEELAGLPGDYSAPEGRLILAFHNKRAAGCVALRKINQNTCEMKRLYVRYTYREKGIGRLLAGEIIEEAKKSGYKKMRLDTTPKMKKAIKLYKSLGFKKIKPYIFNPIKGAVYMELLLG